MSTYYLQMRLLLSLSASNKSSVLGIYRSVYNSKSPSLQEAPQQGLDNTWYASPRISFRGASGNDNPALTLFLDVWFQLMDSLYKNRIPSQFNPAWWMVNVNPGFINPRAFYLGWYPNKPADSHQNQPSLPRNWGCFWRPGPPPSVDAFERPIKREEPSCVWKMG